MDGMDLASSDDSVEEAIRARSLAFAAAYNDGDAARLVRDYFVDDHLGPCASPPGGVAPVRGRGALREMFDGMFAGVPTIRLETIEIVAGGDAAFELGRAHIGMPDGSSAVGRYAVCWLHVDDGWRARTDFFAADGWED